jgi:hypothetical protein
MVHRLLRCLKITPESRIIFNHYLQIPVSEFTANIYTEAVAALRQIHATFGHPLERNGQKVIIQRGGPTLQHRANARAAGPSGASSPQSAEDRARSEERRRHITCFTCGQTGHYANECNEAQQAQRSPQRSPTPYGVNFQSPSAGGGRAAGEAEAAEAARARTAAAHPPLRRTRSASATVSRRSSWSRARPPSPPSTRRASSTSRRRRPSMTTPRSRNPVSRRPAPWCRPRESIAH